MQNPVVFTSTGKSLQGGRIQSIVWDGVTTAADRVVVEKDGGQLWSCTASGTETYKGISFAGNGIAVKNGINVSALPSGTLYIYYLEN